MSGLRVFGKFRIEVANDPVFRGASNDSLTQPKVHLFAGGSKTRALGPNISP